MKMSAAMAISTSNITASNVYDTSTYTINTNTCNTTAGSSYTYTIHSDPTWIVDNVSTSINPDNIYVNGKTMNDYIKEICESMSGLNLKTEKTKENKKMKFGKFNFGPITDGSVAMSIRGLAVKNTAGEFVAYDEKNDEIVEVTGMTFDCGNMIFAVPVALKDVAMGDVIIHNKHYCYVMDGDESVLNVIDVSDGTIKDIMPAKSPFGFNYVTKVISLMDIGKASADSPFGDNFLTMMYMMGGDIDSKMLPLLMMQKGDKMDPMMLALLLK